MAKSFINIIYFITYSTEKVLKSLRWWWWWWWWWWW